MATKPSVKAGGLFLLIGQRNERTQRYPHWVVVLHDRALRHDWLRDA